MRVLFLLLAFMSVGFASSKTPAPGGPVSVDSEPARSFKTISVDFGEKHPKTTVDFKFQKYKETPRRNKPPRVTYVDEFSGFFSTENNRINIENFLSNPENDRFFFALNDGAYKAGPVSYFLEKFGNEEDGSILIQFSTLFPSTKLESVIQSDEKSLEADKPSVQFSAKQPPQKEEAAEPAQELASNEENSEYEPSPSESERSSESAALEKSSESGQNKEDSEPEVNSNSASSKENGDYEPRLEQDEEGGGSASRSASEQDEEGSPSASAQNQESSESRPKS